MNKQARFFSKLLQKLKADEGFRWEPVYVEWLRKLRASVTLDISCPYSELAGSRVMSLQQESFVRALDEQRIAHEGTDEAYVYPGLSVAWEDSPVVVSLSGSFVRSFAERAAAEPEELGAVPLSALEVLMPGCLLIDARKLGFSLHTVELEGLFVYPSYDVERGYVMLLLVGAGLDNGLRFPLQSKLVLKGRTFADAVRASEEERAFLASMWWAEGSEQGLVEVFTPLDDDAELMHLAAQLLAMICSPQAQLCRYSAPLWESIDVTLAPAPVLPAATAEGSEGADEGDESSAGAASTPPTATQDPGEHATLASPSPAVDDELQRMLEAQEARIGELELMVTSLQARISSLNYSLELAHITGAELREEADRLRGQGQLLQELEVPTTPLESLQLARRAFPTQLAFLPSALKSAEEFRSGSAAEVWAVLRSMATVLQPLFASGKCADISAEFQAKAGFELALRDTKATKSNPKLQRLRRFEYKGQERDASAHVKGRSTKPGKCLRVYFFYEPQDKQLVIAHCGDHLKSVGSPK
ncbi:MAG: hypothetical protein ACI36Y_05750 [Coriobacteriales bacterium]